MKVEEHEKKKTGFIFVPDNVLHSYDERTAFACHPWTSRTRDRFDIFGRSFYTFSGIWPSIDSLSDTLGPQNLTIISMEKIMKIAANTGDGKTISQHFGRASHFMVLNVQP